MSPTRAVILFVIVLGSNDCARAQKVDPQAISLLKTVCQARDTGKRFIGEYTFREEVRDESKPDTPPSSVAEERIVQGEVAGKVESVRSAGGGPDDPRLGRRFIRCANGRYSFSAEQVLADGQGIVQKFFDTEEGNHELGEQIAHEAANEQLAATVRAVPYSDLVEHPLTRLTSVSVSGEPGARVLQFDFTWNPNPEERKGVRWTRVWRDGEVSGTVRLSEAVGWKVASSDITSKQKTSRGGTAMLRTESTVEYAAPDARGNVLVNSAVQKTYRGTAYGFTVHFTDFRYTPRTPGVEEFTLTHYGFPEPEGVAPVSTPMPLWVWLLSAAAVFAALAVLLRWIVRRRTRASSPVSPTEG